MSPSSYFVSLQCLYEVFIHGVEHEPIIGGGFQQLPAMLIYVLLAGMIARISNSHILVLIDQFSYDGVVGTKVMHQKDIIYMLCMMMVILMSLLETCAPNFIIYFFSYLDWPTNVMGRFCFTKLQKLYTYLANDEVIYVLLSSWHSRIKSRMYLSCYISMNLIFVQY